MIFVFGSNLAGRHGAGAAKHAVQYYGAQYGVSAGITGQAYAIPTKDAQLRTLSIDEITKHAKIFVDYAVSDDRNFLLTPIGTGLAGHSKKDIWDMFVELEIPDNVFLSSSSLNR